VERRRKYEVADANVFRSTVRMVDGIVDELEETRILARTEKVRCYSRRLNGDVNTKFTKMILFVPSTCKLSSLYY